MKDATARMPVLFVGHGSPENGVEDNEFSREWVKIAKTLPKPKAILSISAHWETDGNRVTGMAEPKTIHDFYGFQDELYEKEYPAPGSPELAGRVAKLLKSHKAGLDMGWGLDHGTWIVLTRMYPKADIPVVQLSLDDGASDDVHYNIGAALRPLRDEGILILGSGNIVHNLGMMAIDDEPYPWASEFDRTVKGHILRGEHDKLIDYSALKNSGYAIPTNEHYLPLIYALGAAGKDDKPEFHCEKIFAKSVGMTTIVFNSIEKS
jgi:4,5-DOPA dioxygenase extradiol